MSGTGGGAVAAAASSTSNELGGVKPLALGQYGELGPGFEQLLDQLMEEAGCRHYVLRYRRGTADMPQPRAAALHCTPGAREA
jgi:hypothetical protein